MNKVGHFLAKTMGSYALMVSSVAEQTADRNLMNIERTLAIAAQ